jgi:hypothetical protein
MQGDLRKIVRLIAGGVVLACAALHLSPAADRQVELAATLKAAAATRADQEFRWHSAAVRAALRSRASLLEIAKRRRHFACSQVMASPE